MSRAKIDQARPTSTPEVNMAVLITGFFFIIFCFFLFYYYISILNLKIKIAPIPLNTSCNLHKAHITLMLPTHPAKATLRNQEDPRCSPITLHKVLIINRARPPLGRSRTNLLTRWTLKKKVFITN
jgi:hypothetical protein